MSIASLVWNAMQLYSLAGHSHNACKLLKKWQTPEKSQNEIISNQVIMGIMTALVHNYLPPHRIKLPLNTNSVPPMTLDEWTPRL